RVDVLRVALERRAITGVGLVEFALLKINVAELGMMVRLVQMMNLRGQFFDPPPVMGAGQFESARARSGAAIDGEKIPETAKAGRDQDEERPHPFPISNGINEHPGLESNQREGDRGTEEPLPETSADGQKRVVHCASHPNQTPRARPTDIAKAPVLG